MGKEEIEKLKNFKLYAFEGDVYVKADDYKKIAIENKELKLELEQAEEDYRRLENEYLLLKNK